MNLEDLLRKARALIQGAGQNINNAVSPIVNNVGNFASQQVNNAMTGKNVFGQQTPGGINFNNIGNFLTKDMVTNQPQTGPTVGQQISNIVKPLVSSPLIQNPIVQSPITQQVNNFANSYMNAFNQGQNTQNQMANKYLLP